MRQRIGILVSVALILAAGVAAAQPSCESASTCSEGTCPTPGDVCISFGASGCGCTNITPRTATPTAGPCAEVSECQFGVCPPGFSCDMAGGACACASNTPTPTVEPCNNFIGPCDQGACAPGRRCVSFGASGCGCIGELFTPTATATQTLTPTQTPIPIGGTCVDPSTCASGFCVDGVCCNEACDGPDEACDFTSRPGICISSTASAPALSPWAGAAALAALCGIAALALRHRRTQASAR